MRRLRLVWVLGLGAPLVAVAAWAVDEWHFRSERDEVRREVAQGRYAKAWPRLVRLAARRPDDGEIQYYLGTCESVLGRQEDAAKAWSRVPDASPFSGQAAIQRARSLLARHRLAEAEVLLPKAMADRGDHSLEAFETLLNLLKIEGRFEEAIRLVWDYADRYPDPIALLKELAVLGSARPHKLEWIQGGLETASRASPDDERVWLGWANLANRVGRFEEAGRWLHRCQKQRPDDPVWRGRLNLALATQDVPAAWGAVEHLSPKALGPSDVLSLRAWFASLAADEPTERRALAELLTLEPANFRALDRMAELELQAGRPDEAAKLRAHRADLDRSKARYDEVLFRPEAPDRAAELARLAESLGWSREARLLWTFEQRRHADAREPAEALARLNRPPAPPPKDSELPALLADRPAKPGPGRGPSPATVAARPIFSDDADAAGLKFVFENGGDPLRPMHEAMGGGVGLLDFDGDGWLDVYCVQGGSCRPGALPTVGDRLFRNQGNGTFVDVSAASGIESMPRGYGNGVAVGDVDNDGRPDLFVTRIGSYALYRNKGDGTFEDVTRAMGLAGPRDWPTSAAFADLDNDGDLDLYVCHYGEWDPAHPRTCRDPVTGKPIVCEPLSIRSMPDHLFRNDGGKFVDVSAEAGIVDTQGHGLGVVACDFDKDGRVDLFVANDQSANFLFRNLGGLRFEEVGETAGAGTGGDGQFQANMGVACGDANGDGLPDLAVTEYYNEGAAFYLNLGGGLFSDHSKGVGLRAATRSMLGFGIAFFDYDADGMLDLAIANGHIEDLRPAVPYAMPCQLLTYSKRGRFVDLTSQAGPPWQVPRVARALATGDLDNDGRVDLVLLSYDRPLAYFHNKTAGGHRLTLQLQGATSNRDAVGAVVTVTAGDRRQTAWRFGGGSYQSAADPRLHFGLGEANRAARVEVAWPSGRVDRYDSLTPDAGYLLIEADPTPKPLPSFSR